MKLQKLGGYAAICFVCILVPTVIVMASIMTGPGLRRGPLDDPVKSMAAASAAPASFNAVGVVFIVWLILFLIMVLALHERMQARAPLLTRLMLIAASAGTIVMTMYYMIFIAGNRLITSTQDVSAFRALLAINGGLLDTVGLLGAWTCLFMGCAVLKTQSFSWVLGWLFLSTGILWMLHFMISLIPIHFISLGIAVFWVGIALLRQKQPQPAAKKISAAPPQS